MCCIYDAGSLRKLSLMTQNPEGLPKLITNIEHLKCLLPTEEILNSDNTIWFSPEGRYLCYAEIDDTDVPWYEFSWYGDYQENYTSVRKIPYPKSGYPNPTVKVKVIDLHNLPSAGKAVPTQVLHEPDEFKAT